MMEDKDLVIQVPLQFPQPLLLLRPIPFLRAPAIRQIQIQIQILTAAVEARTAAGIFQRTEVAATIQIPIRTHQVDQLGEVEEIHQQDTASVTATEVIVAALRHQIPVPVSMIC